MFASTSQGGLHRALTVLAPGGLRARHGYVGGFRIPRAKSGEFATCIITLRANFSKCPVQRLGLSFGAAARLVRRAGAFGC